MTQIKPIFEGDMRYETLLQALCDTVYERGKGLPVPGIIGVLEILKIKIMEEAE